MHYSNGECISGHYNASSYYTAMWNSRETCEHAGQETRTHTELWQSGRHRTRREEESGREHSRVDTARIHNLLDRAHIEQNRHQRWQARRKEDRHILIRKHGIEAAFPSKTPSLPLHPLPSITALTTHPVPQNPPSKPTIHKHIRELSSPAPLPRLPPRPIPLLPRPLPLLQLALLLRPNLP